MLFRHACWTFCWGHPEEHFSKIILNFEQCLRRRMMSFRYFLPRALAAPFSVEKNLLCNFVRWHHEEHFWEVILNLDQWFRRCCLRHFSSRALAAPLLVELNYLCNFCKGHYGEHSCEIIINLDQWFRGRCRYRQCTMDGHRPIIIALFSLRKSFF